MLLFCLLPTGRSGTGLMIPPERENINLYLALQLTMIKLCASLCAYRGVSLDDLDAGS